MLIVAEKICYDYFVSCVLIWEIYHNQGYLSVSHMFQRCHYMIKVNPDFVLSEIPYYIPVVMKSRILIPIS